MTKHRTNRRAFLAGVAATPVVFSMAGLGRRAAAALASEKPRHAVERPGVGAIGLRYQGSVIAYKAALYGDIVAVCDVDRHVRDQAKAAFGSTPRSFEDYRELLERDDVDVVCLGTPDHWHTKMVIDAYRAGKDQRYGTE